MSIGREEFEAIREGIKEKIKTTKISALLKEIRTLKLDAERKATLYYDVIKSEPSYITQVPALELDQEICIAAAAADIHMLDITPKKYKNAELFSFLFKSLYLNEAMIYLINNKNDVNLSPNEYKELLTTALKKPDEIDLIKVFKNIPPEQRSDLMMTMIAQRNADATNLLEQMVEKREFTIDEETKVIFTEDQYAQIIIYAIADDPRLLKGISDNYSKINLSQEQIKTIAVKSIQQNAACIPYASIEGDALLEQAAIDALKNDSSVIRYFPEYLATRDEYKKVREKWQEAAKNNPELIRDSSAHLLTQEICSNAVRADPYLAEYMPAKYRNLDVCQVLLDKAAHLLRNYLYHDQNKTSLSPDDIEVLRKVTLEKLKNSEVEIYQVPERLLSEEAYWTAITNNLDAINKIPKKLKTQKLFNYAINHTDQPERVLQYLNKHQESCNLSKADFLELAREIVNKNSNDSVLHYTTDKTLPDIALLIAQQKTSRMKDELLNTRSCYSYIQHEEITLSDDDYRKFCLAAISSTPRDIKKIPPDMRSEEICLQAVAKDISTLKYVPSHILEKEAFQSKIPEWREHAKNDWEAIIDAPEEFFSEDVCQAAINANIKALGHIPKKFRTYESFLLQAEKKDTAGILVYLNNYEETTNLTTNQYNELIDNVIQNNSVTSLRHYCPSDMLYELSMRCLKLKNLAELSDILTNKGIYSFINQSSHKLKDDEYLTVCNETIKYHPLAIKQIPENKRTNDMYIMAAQKDFHAVIYMPDDILSLQKLKDPVEKWQKQAIKDWRQIKGGSNRLLKNILENIQHIVVTEYLEISPDNEMSASSEIEDTYMVYASLEKRKGKTIHINKSELSEILFELKRVKPNASKLNLVLLGHANTGAASLAGLDIPAIATVLSDNDAINRVTLLGCNTAKSKALEKEKEMAREYRDILASPSTETESAVIIAYSVPDKSKFDSFFKKMSTDKQGNHTNQLLILTNNQQEKNHTLVTLKRDPDSKQITEAAYQISSEKMQAIRKLIGGKNGKIPFASKKNPTIYYRGGKSSAFISTEDTTKMNDIVSGSAVARFSRQHPSYKEDKAIFPFLAGATMHEEEEDKLLPSLLLSLKDAIKVDPRIERDITLKGYTKGVHVDTKERQMKVARTHLYPSDYGRSGHGFFEGRKENIKRKELKKEQKARMSEMRKEDSFSEDKESDLKSISFTVKKR